MSNHGLAALWLSCLLVGSFLVAAGPVGTAAAANTDADTLVVGGDGAYDSVQNAVENASDGDRVELRPGTYAQTVTIDRNLSLVATGDVTVERNFATYSSGNNIVTVANGAHATISGLTVTGDNVQTGILVTDGAYANVTDVTVDDVADDPLTGAQHGVGIAVGRPLFNTTAPPATATVEDSRIEEFQKSAVFVGGQGSFAEVRNNTIVGQGTQSKLAQDSILLDQRASAAIVDNDVRNVRYESGDGGRFDGGTGVSFYGGVHDTLVAGNTFENVSDAVLVGAFAPYFGDANGAAEDVSIRNNTVVDSQSGLTFFSAPGSLPTDGVVARDLAVLNNTYRDGKLFGLAISNGNVENAVVAGNEFVDNPVQVADSSDGMFDTRWLLQNNDFDRAVVTQTPAGPIDNTTIWSSIQAGADAADPGDTVSVGNGTYNESVSVTTPNVTLRGLGTPTVVGDGAGVGSQPHAAIHVADTTAGSPPSPTGVTVRGFTVRNPHGHYGIYAGSGGSGANLTGLTVAGNSITDVGTAVSSPDPLSGAVAGFYARADYERLRVADNLVRNVVATDGTRASGLSFSSFVGTRPAFADGVFAEDTLVVNNTVAGIVSGDRAKGIAVSGEFDGLRIENNNVTRIDGDDGNALGITLTENPNGGDIDGDGDPERVGPRNFTVTRNVVARIDAASPAALFVGGYEDLGTARAATDNTLLAPVQRYNGAQPGFELADADPLNATANWWGAATGPSGRAPGTGVPVGGSDTTTAGVEFAPFYVDPARTTLNETAANATVQPDGTATVNLTDAESTIETATVTLPSPTADAVAVVPAPAPTGTAPSPPSDLASSVTTYVAIAGDSTVTGSVAVSIVVEESAVADPDRAVLLHYTDGSWTELATTVTDAEDGVRLTATADRLSPFAVARSPADQRPGDGGSDVTGGGGGAPVVGTGGDTGNATTETATPTATPSTTTPATTPTDETATPTTEGEQSPAARTTAPTDTGTTSDTTPTSTATDAATTDGTGAGFGPVVAALAVLLLAALARRR